MSIHKFNTDIQHEGRLIVERVADISVLPYDSTSSVTDEARILYDEASDNLYYGTISTFKPIQSGAEPFTKVIDVAGGGDYSSIATAVSTEPAGTSFFIKGGVYNENVVLTKTQNLIGESTSIVVVNGYIKFDPGVIMASINSLATVTQDGTTVTDPIQTFQSDGFAAGHLISLNGAIHEVASVTDETNLELTSPYRGPTEAVSVPYILLGEFIKEASVKNIHINGNTANTMLTLSGCMNCVVSNVSLNGPGTTGLGGGFTLSGACVGNKIQINYITHSERVAVNMSGEYNSIDIGHIGNSVGNGISIIQAYDNDIKIGTIAGNGGNGLNITQSFRNNITVDQIERNIGSGINMTLEVEDNIFKVKKCINNEATDLYVTSTTDVRSNTFDGGIYGDIDLKTTTSNKLYNLEYDSLIANYSSVEVSTKRRSAFELDTVTTALGQEHSGMLFANVTSSLKTYTLPAAAPGLYFIFMKSDTGEVRITPASGDTIMDSGSNNYIFNDKSQEHYAMLTLMAIDGNNWFISAGNGTWKTEIP